jgi:hypothetical protein
MKKWIWLLSLVVLLAIPSLAQDQTDSSQQNPAATDQEPAPKPKKPPLPTPKAEISAGYTLHKFDVQSGSNLNLNGWYFSGEYNVLRRWLAVEGDLSGAYENQGISGDTSLYTAMVGPKIYPFKRHMINPYLHVMFGEGYVRISFPPYAGFPAFVRSDTAHTWQGGGGLEMYRWEHLGIRLVQFDYGSTNFFKTGSSSYGQTNYRVSIGLTYRWGEK